MNNPIVQNAANGTSKTAEQTQHSSPGNGAPVAAKLEPTVKEVVHQVTPKDEIKTPVSPVPAKDAVNTPSLAAKRDDNIASQQKPS